MITVIEYGSYKPIALINAGLASINAWLVANRYMCHRMTDNGRTMIVIK